MIVSSTRRLSTEASQTSINDRVSLVQLLAWLCAGREQKGMAEAAEAHHIALALSALAHTPGRRGLGLASVWLGDMLVALSRNVKTYSSIRVVGFCSITRFMRSTRENKSSLALLHSYKAMMVASGNIYW